MIDLYAAATSNGHQASVALELQMGGMGPTMGQANEFFRYFPEKTQPAIERCQGETQRLFRVLDGHLQNHEYLAGDYSIADIANRAGVRMHRWSGVELDGVPNLKRWRDRIRARPGVQRGTTIPPSDMDLAPDATGQKAEASAQSARTIVEAGQSR